MALFSALRMAESITSLMEPALSVDLLIIPITSEQKDPQECHNIH